MENKHPGYTSPQHSSSTDGKLYLYIYMVITIHYMYKYVSSVYSVLF